VAPAIKIPKPGKTGTPKGMEGVRFPSAPRLRQSGYKLPYRPEAAEGVLAGREFRLLSRLILMARLR
jgi:hypothetical protein